MLHNKISSKWIVIINIAHFTMLLRQNDVPAHFTSVNLAFIELTCCVPRHRFYYSLDMNSLIKIIKFRSANKW